MVEAVEATFDFLNPDYDAIYQARAERLKRIRENPGAMLPGLKAHYKHHPVDFITDWGMTFDPRNPEIDMPAIVPFVLFPKQEHFIDWLLGKWKTREDGLTEKSRDMGVTWLCVAFAVWMWLFWPGTVVGFGSRKEEYVDKIGDPKSIFWKIRQFVNLLPTEFRPAGYTEKDHAPHMRVLNPESGSAIIGEAGDNIGRGNRASIYFKDEAQPLHAKVLTPSGWKTMAEMVVGALVVGHDGLPRRVTQIKDCGNHPVYRLGFSDGTFAECSPNHLWTVNKAFGKRERLTLPAHEIAATLSYESPGGQRQFKYRVQTCAPVRFAQGPNLPLDPYVVGALLGDGSVGKGTPRLTSADAELVAEVAARLPEGVSVSTSGGISYRLVCRRGSGRCRGGNLMQHLLSEIGLAGMRSGDKHIPDTYKLASPQDRLALLQGLMDTDGSASGGVASFHTSSARLAADTLFVVQSLGGTATHNVKSDARGHRDMHVLHLMLPGMSPFRLARKKGALPRRKHPPGRTITSVSLLGEMPVRCITIDAKDGLYLTDHCIVTHNSAFYEHADAIDAALSMTSNCNIDVSTPNGPGNPFYLKRHGGKMDVFTFHWKDDPRKDKAWYEKQKRRLDPVKVAQEIDINYEASVGDAFIQGELVDKAMATGVADVQPVGPVQLGVDCARFGPDKTVITARRGRAVLFQRAYAKLEAPDVVAHVINVVESFGLALVRQIAVDTIGIGGPVADYLRRKYPAEGDEPSIVVDVNVSLRVNDGVNYNLKAQIWERGREWLGQEPCSLPNDPELKSQLTSLKYYFRGGLRLMEDKAEAKARGIKSPDHADSLMLTFAYPCLPVKAAPAALPTFEQSVEGMGMLG